jgi:o-succinylbenzoate synthase
MKVKKSWFIKLWDSGQPDVFGVGECGPLPGLSKDDLPELERILQQAIGAIQGQDMPQLTDLSGVHEFLIRVGVPDTYSSINFAFETALLDLLNGGDRTIFKNGFLEKQPIPINGLVWMGGLDFMLQQVEIKIRDGYRCVKLKVGGLDFEKECDILQYIRRKYFREGITIRLDANGAFKVDEAMYKLNELARFEVHSIEQPIKAGRDEMVELCQKSPIPIALDEELIGVNGREEKGKLLSRIRPPYIILKPTLHGGLYSCQEWIELAEKQGIGWWITSALESNIGLNAIAQFTSQHPVDKLHGLGTGSLYTDNFESPLTVEKGFLSYDKRVSWDITPLFPLATPME